MASERLSELTDGRLLYGLRHRWRDGTTHVAFEPLELIDRLAALVPPPRFHTVRYHGVLASRSKLRAEVVPDCNAHVQNSTTATATGAGLGPIATPTPEARSSRPSRYYCWSELMRRVFDVDVLRCPRCQTTPMRILAAIHPPTATRAILESLGLPTRAPPIAPARPVLSDWSVSEPATSWRGTSRNLSAA